MKSINVNDMCWVTLYLKDAEGWHTFNDENKKEQTNLLFFVNGFVHSVNDEPAFLQYDGTKMWFKNGKTHRDNDLPAIEYADNTKKWFKNGGLHRDNDLPAIINPRERKKEWWFNGEKHRENNLPSVEYENGTKEWHTKGLLHREDGPALYWILDSPNNIKKEYHLKGKKLSEEEFIKWQLENDKHPLQSIQKCNQNKNKMKI